MLTTQNLFFCQYKWILTIFSLNLRSQIFINKLWLNQETDINIITVPSILRNNILFLKQHKTYNYTQLIDIISNDMPKETLRFSLNYVVFSTLFSSKLNLIVKTNEVVAIATISDLFISADWSEREVWDLFGIFFVKHKNLDRILTDYGFEGHPLRKSYPLTGFQEITYSPSKQKFLYLNTFSKIS